MALKRIVPLVMVAESALLLTGYVFGEFYLCNTYMLAIVCILKRILFSLVRFFVRFILTVSTDCVLY